MCRWQEDGSSASPPIEACDGAGNCIMGHVKMFVSRFAYLSLTIALVVASATLASAQEAFSTPGWHQLPNTKIKDVCAATHGFPQIAGAEECFGILSWSGGAFDTKRNRLIVWGGGHNAYYGNELYALNLQSFKMERLTDPGLPPASYELCSEAIANGAQPNSRHTYGGLAYIPTTDQFFINGGAIACGASGRSTATWTFDFTALTWQNRNPGGVTPAWWEGKVSDYDPNTQKVYLHDAEYLNVYDPAANTWQRLSPYEWPPLDGHQTAVIDPKRRKFVIVGAGAMMMYDLSAGSTYTRTNLTTTGGDALVNSAYPGLAYDPVSDRIVGWNGGDTVYSLNLDTNVWTPITYPGGPSAPSRSGSGTHGRWRYAPAVGAFVLVNEYDQDAYLFRLSSTTADVQAPSIPHDVTATATSVSQVTLSWVASTDNIGVAAYQLYRDGKPIGTSPQTMYLDPSLAPATTYLYAVAAVDAAGNVSALSSPASVTTPASPRRPSGDDPEADFQARCQAPGVVRCVGFDNTTSDIVQNVNLWPDGDGVFRGGLDTTIKASGAGSLRFELPSNGGANIAGQWSQLVPPYDGLGAHFGEGSTFYVQFRQRFSSEMLANTAIWDSRWKQVAFYMNQVACAGVDLTTAHYNYGVYPDNFPIMYANCGARPLYTNNGAPPTDLQQGDYNCHYGSFNATDCLYYTADTWMTFYYQVSVGVFGQNNSSVKAWAALPGKPYKQWINMPNWRIDYNNGHDDYFNNITFLPYMTRLSRVTAPTAYTWYDELIVSTQPIAAPDAPTEERRVPHAPGNLQASKQPAPMSAGAN